MPTSPEWWHTIELPSGEVTPGGWDLRPTSARLPWPASLEGMRCLDVGTMDGYWAFEMERRGAASVVATDVFDPARPTFVEAARRLGSAVSYRTVSVHELDAAGFGTFDLVVVGYVLQMVSDPVGALRTVRGVCSGSVIVLDTVSLPLSLLPAPLARLCARRGFHEWFVFNRAGLLQLLRLAGFAIEAVSPILRDHPGPGVTPGSLPWSVRARHTLGILGRSLAVRARPVPEG